jgi:hypothetical protein
MAANSSLAAPICLGCIPRLYPRRYRSANARRCERSEQSTVPPPNRRVLIYCPRHGRACPGHPRGSACRRPKKLSLRGAGCVGDCGLVERRGWPGQARHDGWGRQTSPVSSIRIAITVTVHFIGICPLPKECTVVRSCKSRGQCWRRIVRGHLCQRPLQPKMRTKKGTENDKDDKDG